jgi:hypothetical protein
MASERQLEKEIEAARQRWQLLQQFTTTFVNEYLEDTFSLTYSYLMDTQEEKVIAKIIDREVIDGWHSEIYWDRAYHSKLTEKQLTLLAIILEYMTQHEPGKFSVYNYYYDKLEAVEARVLVIGTDYTTYSMEITPQQIHKPQLTDFLKKVTPSQLQYLSTEAQAKYAANLEWYLSQEQYLRTTQRDLKQTSSYETPDTYKNLKATEYRLEQQIKFLGLWFNEIHRWFPLSQFKSPLVREIVVRALNEYILAIAMPQYSYEKGLTTAFREIKITLDTKINYPERHDY